MRLLSKALHVLGVPAHVLTQLRPQQTYEDSMLCHALSDWLATAPDFGDVATAHLCFIKIMHGEREFDAWDMYVIRRAARQHKAWLEAIGHGVDAMVLQDQLDELERTRIARPGQAGLVRAA